MKKKVSLLFSFFLMIVVLSSFCFAQYTSSILKGQHFVWAQHSQRELTEKEIQFVANNYDLVVVGNQNKPMDKEVNRIKEINPNIKILVYFPTSVRQKTAKYGANEFKEEWYLHNFTGGRIPKTRSLDFVDLTNEEYIEWARLTTIEFLRLAPYDGFVFDNANPIGVVTGSQTNWLKLITKEKLNDWNKARENYLARMTRIMDNRNKVLIYNGIHRLPSKVNRTLDTAKFTHGALNEAFCYGKVGTEKTLRFYPKELLLEDIDLQFKLGNENKYVLQKVNWEEGDKYMSFCYSVFLMGYVPNYTYFKHGKSYNLVQTPDEYKIKPKEYKLLFNNPKKNYIKKNWILSREFENGWVIVNLGKNEDVWILPEKLELWQNGQLKTILLQNTKYKINGKNSTFFLKPGMKIIDPQDFDKDLDVDIDDVVLLVSNFETNNNEFDLNEDKKIGLLDLVIIGKEI